MNEPKCFNCETGIMIPGTYGRYCLNCDTYLPTGKAEQLASRYFEAVDTGDQVRAGELKVQLDECRRVTIGDVEQTCYN